MKMTILSGTVLVCICFKLHAQQPIDKLIAAERSFAATSKEQTTKIAFLSFLDSNCVGYRNGEQVNLFEEYSKRKEDSSKLTWAPEFAVISSSGNIGATTGPWEYRQSSLKDTPVAHGHFTTIWKKNDKGEWKAAFDMGISYDQKQNSNNKTTEIILTKPAVMEEETGALALIDLNFSDAFEIDKKYAASKVITNDSWFSIQGNAPYKDVTSITEAMNRNTDKIKFSPPSHVIVSDNTDMFAVSGNAQTGDKKQAYMRLWIKQGDMWKLLMMVIH
jgi:hypothetical protein